MVDEEHVNEETTDLLDKIDALKKQIKTFENELGIDTWDLKAKWSEGDSKVFEKMRESESQLGVLENMVKSTPPDVVLPEQKEPETPQQPSVQETPQISGLQDKAAELRLKSEQVAQITALVSRLRNDMIAEKQRSVQAAPPAQKLQPVQPVQPPKPVQAVRYSAEDIPSLNTLVQKLADLVKENAAISEELREMIDETRNVNKASRISELIRKLAVAGLSS